MAPGACRRPALERRASAAHRCKRAGALGRGPHEAARKRAAANAQARESAASLGRGVHVALGVLLEDFVSFLVLLSSFILALPWFFLSLLLSWPLPTPARPSVYNWRRAS